MTPAFIPLAILTLFAAAPVVYVLAQRARGLAVVGTAAAMLVSLILLASQAGAAGAGEVLLARYVWLTAWGLDLSFRLDGLGVLFALLVLGIGILVVLYAAYYLPAKDSLDRFYALLLTFAGGMLGVVLAENLLLLLAFWEVTSIASFLLIGYKYDYHDSRIAARMALAVTGGGGLALLAGLLLLGQIAGSFELSVVLQSGPAIREHPLYAPMLVLVLVGAFTKSAQFPFHFWLPHAMAAPTPVSAYLHSATMVKAGVFLLARLYPALAGTDLWFVLVGATGAVTLVYGAYIALLKDDFKGLLAYSTISHLGLITLLFGLATPLTAVAAVFHIINHAIFKASLFMAAGIIDHECGTRDMRLINGLFRYMPWTATLGIVAASSMAGVPLLNGFLSKEMFFAETIGHPAFDGYTRYLLPTFATMAGALAVAYSTRFVHDVFFNGAPRELPRTPGEPPRWMLFPVEVLVALCLLVGLFPQFAIGGLLGNAVGAVLQESVPDYDLAIWHGFNLPLAMSVVALGGGLLHYWRRHHLFDLHARYAAVKLSSPVAFERVFRSARRGAVRVLALIDNVSLQRYLAWLISTVLALGLWAYLGGVPANLRGAQATTPADALGLAALVALTIGALGTVHYQRQRLLAVVFLSVVGLIVTLVFLRFSAPDLALTQISVEVVTIVLLLSALRYLPELAPAEDMPARRWRDTVLALLAGLGIGALAYAMATRPFSTISAFHLAQAVPGGGGANVVNVILVDFRGFDTLGEIAVLTMAALGVHALLDRSRIPPCVNIASTPGERYPLMLNMLMRPLLPLTLTVSVYILLRGHNAPGGGFIAGLVTAIALMLQYVASGIVDTRARLRVDHVRILAVGMLIALATGAASWLFAHPFLTSAFTHVELPIVGEIELASAMIFDIGVYLVVVASVLMILAEIGELSRRDTAAIVAGQG
jgi:multicomponent K+:H+ antiporter subunit A